MGCFCINVDMLPKAKIYKGMGYLFPFMTASAIATGMPGTVALVLYWLCASQIKEHYIKTLSREIASLEAMQREVVALIQSCEQCNAISGNICNSPI